jgi:transposase
MATSKGWELSDELWKRIEPLLPPEPARHREQTGQRWRGGRKRADRRQVLAGILYVLRTGCQWKAVPREFGAGSTIHGWFIKWSRDGVFARLWDAGLAEYDEMEGIAWRWQAIDGAMTKAPLGGEATGPNPTDRGKKRNEASRSRRRAWGPAIDRRHRGQRQ